MLEEIFVRQRDNHSSTQRSQHVYKSAGSDLPQLDNHPRTESRLCLSTIERKLLTEREREKTEPMYYNVGANDKQRED